MSSSSRETKSYDGGNRNPVPPYSQTVASRSFGYDEYEDRQAHSEENVTMSFDETSHTSPPQKSMSPSPWQKSSIPRLAETEVPDEEENITMSFDTSDQKPLPPPPSRHNTPSPRPGVLEPPEPQWSSSSSPRWNPSPKPATPEPGEDVGHNIWADEEEEFSKEKEEVEMTFA